MILEYQKGEQWGGMKAPRANRFILSHDKANGILSSLETFAESLPQYGADVIVLG